MCKDRDAMRGLSGSIPAGTNRSLASKLLLRTSQSSLIVRFGSGVAELLFGPLFYFHE